MLAPRFTLRGLLITVTAVAVWAWAAHLGLEGNALAAGLAVGALMIVASLVVQAAVFCCLIFLAFASGRFRKPHGNDSPQHLLLVAMLAAGGIASAQPAPSNWFMPGSTMIGDGMQLQLSTGPRIFPGNFLVRIELTPTAPLPVDREVTVQVRSRTVTGGTVLVHQQLVVPRSNPQNSIAGGLRLAPTATLLTVPTGANADSYELRLFAAGNELNLLRTQFAGYHAQFAGGYGIATPWMLVIQADGETAAIAAEGLGELFLEVTRAQYANQGWTPPGLDKVRPLDTVRSATFSELPPRWLDYAGLDLICLSQDRLNALRQARPDAWTAILDWTSCGGNLLVYDVADLSAECLAQLDALLTAPKLANRPENDTPVVRPSRWQVPIPGDAAFRQKVITSSAAFSADARPTETAEGNDASLKDATAKPPASPPTSDAIPLRIRPQLRGTLTAWKEPSPFGIKSGDWAWVLNAITPERWHGPARWDSALGQDDEMFWAFLVPGTGRAPVLGFQILITLFVIAVGPVAHFWLRRRKRLDWIVVTTPLIATIVTAGLFAFALAREGTALKARARSFTELDQVRGEQASLSRLSYYAAWTTGGHLRFTDRTWVQMRGPVGGMPLHRGEARTRWHDGFQELTGGWLPTRVPTQLLTLRPQITDRRLEVQAADTGAPPTVSNHLAAPIAQLWLTDDAGRTFTTSAPLAPGQSATLQPCPDAQRNTAIHLDAQTLKVPEDIANLSNWQLFGQARWWGFTGMSMSITSKGLLEESLDPATLSACALQPRRYLAILKQPRDFEWGRDDAQVVDEFHVLLGHW